jgi:hypothetical protein
MMLFLLAALRLWMPYQDFCAKLKMDELAKGPPATHDRFEVLIKANAPVHAWVKSAELDVGQGVIWPLTRDLWSENPPVMTDLPAGEHVKMQIEFLATLPLDLEHPFAAIDQANAAIKQAAGLLSFAAPKMKSLVLVFSKPAEVRVGAELRRTGADNSLKLDRTGEQVQIPEQPIEARLSD